MPSANYPTTTWLHSAPGSPSSTPQLGTGSSSATSSMAGWMLWLKRPFGMPAKGVAPTCESPRDAAILGLLPSSAGRGPAAGGCLLCLAATGFQAPLSSPEESRPSPVCSGRLASSAAGGRGWPGSSLVLDRDPRGIRQDPRSLVTGEWVAPQFSLMGNCHEIAMLAPPAKREGGDGYLAGWQTRE